MSDMGKNCMKAPKVEKYSTLFPKLINNATE